MQVIGFFKGFFDNFSGIITFINTPLKSLHSSFTQLPQPIADLSVFNMLSIGIGATLLTLFVIHVVRLFIGG